jgi:diguanylate cyclase (GGDEF)-like protein
LANRRALDEQLEEIHALFERHGISYSVVMLDLDRFKAFNDTHGHAAGDSALQVVGKILNTQRRVTDRAFRYGGEEFVVVCQATDARGALMVAERICRRIESSVIPFEGQELEVTISAGVAEIQPAISTRGLLEQADIALYSAKRQGRNRTCAPQVARKYDLQPALNMQGAQAPAHEAR